jgi:ABC-2 type transport system ATP-binding protein
LISVFIPGDNASGSWQTWMMDSHPLIQVKHLNHAYGSARIIRDISFELHKGEVLGFLGPNGAGKSTTMRLLSGTMLAQSGEILVNGKDIQKQPLAAKRQTGYLPETPPLYPHLTVQEYLEYAATLHGIKGAMAQTAITLACDRCGLQQVRHRLIKKLSKGYQQRVGIAQAILHKPDIILLDEPTVGLDPNQIIEIRELIKELGEDHGIILSSHILPEIEMVCSDVLILHQGRLVFSDQVANLSHSASEYLLMECRQEPDPELCSTLPQVLKAEKAGAGQVRLQHLPGELPAGALAQLAHANGWELIRLTPEQKSLEQIFIELTCKETKEEQAA